MKLRHVHTSWTLMALTMTLTTASSLTAHAGGDTCVFGSTDPDFTATCRRELKGIDPATIRYEVVDAIGLVNRIDVHYELNGQPRVWKTKWAKTPSELGETTALWDSDLKIAAQNNRAAKLTVDLVDGSDGLHGVLNPSRYRFVLSSFPSLH